MDGGGGLEVGMRKTDGNRELAVYEQRARDSSEDMHMLANCWDGIAMAWVAIVMTAVIELVVGELQINASKIKLTEQVAVYYTLTYTLHS